MKKFERLEREIREKEIKTAALKLFNEKGFANVTMQDIVDHVTLSKGGVYRIYASTSKILSDLIIDGMHLRNEYYLNYLKETDNLNLELIIKMIVDGLFIYPEIANVYVEFLYEKKRNQELEELYQKIYLQTIKETEELFTNFKTDISLDVNKFMNLLAMAMNALIVAIKVLNLEDIAYKNKDLISELLMTSLLKEESKGERNA